MANQQMIAATTRHTMLDLHAPETPARLVANLFLCGESAMKNR